MTDKIRSVGEMKSKKKYYLAVTNEKERYKVYFINNSDDHIKELILKSPGMVTYDDTAVKTSTKNKVYEDIEPVSYKYIESINKIGHGDFTTYYYFKIVTDKGEFKVQGSLGKRIGFMGTKIPHLGKLGRIIYLD